MEPSRSSPEPRLTSTNDLTTIGWIQGAIAPALAFSTVCDPANPSTAASRTTTITSTVKGYDGMPPHHIGSAVRGKASERIVIVSQTCDIAREISLEPTVLAARAFYTKNEEQIALARNSIRYFVLEDDSGLIVDMTELVVIEKPLLAKIIPKQPNASNARLREFSLWIGDRFSRPAHPEDFYRFVLEPLYENVSALVKAGDSRALFLQSRGVALRVIPPSEHAPFDVRIFALIPSDEPEGNALELGLIKAIADIQPDIFAGIDPAYLNGPPSITPIRFDQISAQQFLDLDPIRF